VDCFLPNGSHKVAASVVMVIIIKRKNYKNRIIYPKNDCGKQALNFTFGIGIILTLILKLLLKNIIMLKPDTHLHQKSN